MPIDVHLGTVGIDGTVLYYRGYRERRKHTLNI
jgi:hypothetical protein